MSKFTNSTLVKYTKLSPNHSGERKKDIDTISIHCIVGHLSLETMGNVFATKSDKGSSCNYGVDDNGRVGMFCEEKNRSWCTSSNSNDQRAITIEVACDKTTPYVVTDAALNGLIKLCADVCRRNDIKKLLWKGDKDLIGNVDRQNMTVHRWFANKACPGDYLYEKHGYIADEVNKLLGVGSKTESSTKSKEYMVVVDTPTLSVRRGPGTNSERNGFVYKNQAYTIVEETTGAGASKWGKLKSGAGWISLDHCLRK